MARSPDYASFWPRYLREHARPGTRRLHYAGTAIGLVALGFALVTRTWALLLVMPLAGYGFAWFAHAVVERNRPATFTHPLWSLVSDYRMFFLWIVGRLDSALAAAGVALDRIALDRIAPDRIAPDRIAPDRIASGRTERGRIEPDRS